MLSVQIPRCNSHRHCPRSGLSLLEVLFSIFIISIGMLGAAMLVVVGNQYAAEANLKDRAASCGTGAFHQILARRMYQPGSWTWITPGQPSPPVTQPVVIDPLLIHFQQLQGSAPPATFRMALNVPRRTWTGVNVGTASTRFALARDVFSWQDDLVFEPPPGDANGRPLPLTYRPGSGTLEASQGEFSWMAIFQRAWPETRSSLSVAQQRLWRVTVVVFARRNLGEQEYSIPNAPGSSVRFYPPGNNLILQNPQTEAQPYLLPDRWILLSARHPAPGNPVFYQWYRIVSVTQLGNTGRWLLRLDGPQWPYPPGGPPVTATVVPDVVAVYDRVIAVDPTR